MNDKIKMILKGVVFTVLCLLCLFSVQTILADKEGGGKDYQKMHSFFDEPENSLDAVFLGSSSSYAYWNPAFAWAEKGIAVYSMTNASQPVEISHFIIDDVRKEQPDALYIINITRMLETEKYYDAKIYRYVNNYPLTANKYKALDYMLDITNVPLKDRVNYYFPIIQFHSRWKDLDSFDLTFPEEPYKSASRYSVYLKKTQKQEPVTVDFSICEEITDTMKNCLEVLMNYCKDEEVKVLFILVPQAMHDDFRNNRQNTVVKILEDNGFDVLDLRKKVEEIGIDYSKHYYDKKHTNIHGSVLVTDYVSDYLIENYGFEDKRGTEEYADWDEDCKAYYKHIAKYLWDEDYEYLKAAEKPKK